MAKSSKQKHRPTDGNDGENGNSITSDVKGKRKRRTNPRESPQPRSSIYRGVTRHRWTGRYEAHLWDKNSWNQSRNKKGRQVYLVILKHVGIVLDVYATVNKNDSCVFIKGAYDKEEAAAHAYDLAALKYCGHDTILNFPVSTYQEELNEMEPQTKEEYIGSLRRKSSGFSRGVSKYRGVARHHHNGRWEARIGRVFGNKYLYLGTYATQEEAAIAYDMAAVKYRGHNAITNFDLSRYTEEESLPPENNNNNDVDDDDDDDDDTASTVKEHPSRELGLTFLDPSPDGPTTTTASSSPFEQKPKSSFRDDVQTSFDFQDSGSFAEEHDVIFGDYDFLASSVFQCGLDA